MSTNNIPFEFIRDNLTGALTVKPMFGMFYIYRGPQIVLMLRQRGNETHLNGVWIAADKIHHEALMKELPPASPFAEFGASSKWLFLPATANGFETAALQLCHLINRGDKRLGRIAANKRTGQPAGKRNKKALK